MMRQVDAMLEGSADHTRQPVDPDARLISADLAPTPSSKRTLSRWDVAALWIGLVVRTPRDSTPFTARVLLNALAVAHGKP